MVKKVKESQSKVKVQHIDSQLVNTKF